MKKLMMLALALFTLVCLLAACTQPGRDTDTTVGETSPEVTADVTASHRQRFG